MRPGFIGLLVTTFALGLAYAFVIPFLSLWGTQVIGMSPGEFGAFMTVTSISGMVLSTILARWSDTRLPRRSLLLWAGVSGALGYLGYAFLQDPIALTVVGSLAMGVASVAFSQLFAHARDELSRPEHLDDNPSYSMGVLRACFALSWTVGPALAAFIMSRYGYREVFLTAAATWVCFIGGVWWVVPRRMPLAPSEQVHRQSVLAVMTQPSNLACFLSFTLTFGAFALSTMNLPLLMTKSLGGTEGHVGVSFGIAALFEVPFMLWFGSLASRGHQTTVIRFGLFIGACYFLALTWARSPYQVYPAQILNAASVAVTASVAILFFQDLTPGQTGLGTTMYSSAYSTGNLVGYLSFGVLVDGLGHQGLFGVCAGLAAAAFVLFFVARRPQISGADPATNLRTRASGTR